MSRWFRHYAGMMRDDKLVRVAVKAKQPIERVVWLWGAMLESACELQDGGQFDIDGDEIAYFLRCEPEEISSILSEFGNTGRINGDRIERWADRQFESDASRERVKKHRENKAMRKRNGDETLQPVTVTPQETETETETDSKKEKEEIPPPLEPRASGDEGDFKSGGGVLSDLIEGRETGFDEAASRLRRLWNEQGLEPPDMGRVAMWLDEGHSVKSIVGAIRDVFNGSGKKAKSLAYFDAALARAKPAPKSSAPAPPTIYVRQLDPAWPAYVEAYRNTKGKDPPTDRAGGWHFPLDLLPAHSTH